MAMKNLTGYLIEILSSLLSTVMYVNVDKHKLA